MVRVSAGLASNEKNKPVWDGVRNAHAEDELWIDRLSTPGVRKGVQIFASITDIKVEAPALNK